MITSLGQISVINMLIYFLTINWIKQYLKQDKCLDTVLEAEKNAPKISDEQEYEEY